MSEYSSLTKSNMKPLIIGVTGVIGSGKSTVCALLQKRGFTVLSGDVITHELYQKGNAGYQKILETFGPQFVNNNEVSRPKLRALVLKNHQKLWILNTLMHPIIRQVMVKKIDALRKGQRERGIGLDDRKGSMGKSATLQVALEAIFFEPRDVGTFVSQLIRVDATDEKIIERVAAQQRDLPPTHLKQWLQNQRKVLREIPVTLLNNGTINELEVALDKLLKTTLQ